MTKNYSTKRALIASVIALVLCISMLIGTTFAWFTDSVTSANNIIKAGNLDVEMYWAEGVEAVPTEDSGWEDASRGAIFNYDKWEPGYVQVRHIKIANVGDLAFKYNVLFVPSGEVTDICNVIDVYYLDPAAQIVDRTDLTDDNKLGTLTEVLANLGQSGNGTLEAGQADTITLALKMQESAGNEYMNKSIGSTFSIQLIAAQLASETDAFDDQYDNGSEYPSIQLGTATKVDGVSSSVDVDTVSVYIPAEAAAGFYTVEVADTEITTDANGKTTIDLDISLKKDGLKVSNNNVTYTVVINIGEGQTDIDLTHNGVPVTDYTYDQVTGELSFVTDSFSPFAVSFAKNSKYYKVYSTTPAEEIFDIFDKGGVISVQDNISLTPTDEGKYIRVNSDVTLTGVKGTSVDFAITTVLTGTGTVTVDKVALKTSKELCVSGDTTLVVNSGEHTLASCSATSNGKIVVNGGILNCKGTYAGILGMTFGENGQLIVNNGTMNMYEPFNLNPNRCDNAYVEINGGTINLLNGADKLFAVRDIMDKDRESGVLRGSSIKITGGVFTTTYQLDSDGDANAFIRNEDTPDTTRVLVSNTYNGEADYNCVVTGGTFYGCWQRADNNRQGTGGVVENTIAGFVAEGYEMTGDATNGYTVTKK